MRIGILALMAIACRSAEKPSIEDDPIPVSDADGDGYDAEEDCDDQDPNS